MPTSSPEVCRTALSGTYQGEEFVNVLHFFKRDGTALTTVDLAAIHGILDDPATDDDAWLNIWQTMDANAVVTQIHSRTLSTDTPVELISTVSLAGVTAGADALPLLAIMLKWTSLYATRRSRGRTYLTGLNASHWDATDTDQVASSIQAALNINAGQFVTAWGLNATYGFCIYSRADAEALEVTPYNEVKGASVSPQVAIQKRRSPGR